MKPLWLALAALVTGISALAQPVEFSNEERERIAVHGPWPPRQVPDPSNRVDGQPAAIALGRHLFFDKRLSRSGKLACASCHQPGQGFQDGRNFTRHGRNTPGLLDVAQQRWFGWDGAHDSLWAATLAPLTAEQELGATVSSVRALFEQDPKLAARYRKVFGQPGPDEKLLVDVAKALAAYQATLVSPRTPFDDFRDALVRGEPDAQRHLGPAASRGLKIFVGVGRCFFCHTGALFANGEFADIGRPFFTAAGADPGRWGGLKQMLSSPFNRLGHFSDVGPEHPQAQSTRHVVTEPRHFGEFRVPGLRGLTRSAPYFHDGSAARLEDAVRHYSELNEERLHADGERILRPLRLTPEQSADLVAFLRSLSPAPRGPGRSKPVKR